MHPASPSAPADRAPLPAPLRWLALGGAWLAVALGFVGVFLPLIPATPFLLVAAALFAVGSPRMHAWLLAHRRFGPYLRDWEREGAIPRRAKVLAMLLLWASVLTSALLFVPLWPVRLVLFAVAAMVSAYVLSRPEPRAQAASHPAPRSPT